MEQEESEDEEVVKVDFTESGKTKKNEQKKSNESNLFEMKFMKEAELKKSEELLKEADLMAQQLDSMVGEFEQKISTAKVNKKGANIDAQKILEKW